MVSMKSVLSSFFLRHYSGLLSEWLPLPGGFGLLHTGDVKSDDCSVMIDPPFQS